MIMGYEDFVKFELYKRLVLPRLPMHSWLEISWTADKVTWEPFNSFKWKSNLSWLWVLKTFVKLELYKRLIIPRLPMHSWLEISWIVEKMTWEPFNSFGWRSNLSWLWVLKTLSSLNYIKDLSFQGCPCIHDSKYHG